MTHPLPGHVGLHHKEGAQPSVQHLATARTPYAGAQVVSDPSLDVQSRLSLKPQGPGGLKGSLHLPGQCLETKLSGDSNELLTPRPLGDSNLASPPPSHPCWILGVYEVEGHGEAFWGYSKVRFYRIFPTLLCYLGDLLIRHFCSSPMASGCEKRGRRPS